MEQRKIFYLTSHIPYLTSSLLSKLVKTFLEFLHRNWMNEGLANLANKHKVANVALDLLVLLQSGQK